MSTASIPSTSLPASDVRFSPSSSGSNGLAHPLDAVDEGVAHMWHNVQEGVSHRYADCEKYVRRSPGSAMITAFTAGYLFKMLPVEAIVAAQVRLALSLVRPALFLYGAAKAYDYLLHKPSSPQALRVSVHEGPL